MKKRRIDIISLGCSKNLVESERLIRRLQAAGFNPVFDSEKPQGEYAIVNTCGFISDAKEESINTILELCELKKAGKIGKVAVMGCLSQRYLDELKSEMPEVDLWYGKFNYNQFIEDIKRDQIKESGPKQTESKGKEILPKSWERSLTTPPHSAYLKISEGCNRFCAFCAIPLITGRHTSRPIEEILEEVRSLAGQGVKEFNVIAQDLSSYGLDLYGKYALAELIDRMAEIEGVEWIRLHYAYPADFPEDVLDVMAKRENVCNYLDIALQHISDPVLTNMRRHISKTETLALLRRIREKVPGIKIRTTLMVGFPGEGEKEFEELKEFVRDQRFDRMGAFSYCEEEDTFAAAHHKDEVSQEGKQQRLDALMALQQDISMALNEEMVGSIQKVLIDRVEGETAYGRTQYDSPEVDPEVIIPDGCNLKPGQFVNIEITDAFPFELIGKLVENDNQKKI